MNLVPKMTATELERVRVQVREHVDGCVVCLTGRGQSPQHTAQLFTSARQVLVAHIRRCHTCRTRGEAARLAHYKVILREYIAGRVRQ